VRLVINTTVHKNDHIDKSLQRVISTVSVACVRCRLMAQDRTFSTSRGWPAAAAEHLLPLGGAGRASKSGMQAAAEANERR
jgi:hypothetical protein